MAINSKRKVETCSCSVRGLLVLLTLVVENEEE